MIQINREFLDQLTN